MSVPEGGYKSKEIQLKDQERNQQDSSTSGFVGGPSTLEAQMNTEAWNNQRNNTNKTSENWPMPGGTSLFVPNMNVNIAKKDNNNASDRSLCNNLNIPRQWSIANTIPSADSFGKINMPQQYSQEVNNDRINPDILSAFKNNPYAQSLNSY